MERRLTKQVLYAVVTILLVLTALIGGWGNSPAFADTSADTSVLEDLRKDGNFNINDYPYKQKDHSIQVIQIAEGTGGELFVYTYQPSQLSTYLVASSINIAKQENNSLEMSFPNYKLKLISNSGVLCKYQVEGFELEKTAVRYYNISNILRPFEYMLDKTPTVGTESEVPNAVGQLWTVRTVGNTVEYGKTDSEVVTITKKYVGFLQYMDGITTSGVPGIYGGIKAQHTIRNFVAFSADRPIDQLKQVELQYALADCSSEYCANPFHTGSSADDPHAFKDYVNRTQGTPVQQAPVVISADEKDGNALHGWVGHKYSWNKIQSTADFLAEQENQSYELTNAAGVNSIEGTQWVLNFYKSTLEAYGNSNIADNHIHSDYQRVTDVIILRLMFEYGGESYNLGVVDSKMTGDDKPLNGAEPLIDPLPTWAIVLIVIGVVIVGLIVLAIFFPTVAKILAAPFKGIWALIKAINKNRKERQRRNEELKQEKQARKESVQLAHYQNKLIHKERQFQARVEAQDKRKAEIRAEKRQEKKDKQAAKKRRKAAKNRAKQKGKKK